MEAIKKRLIELQQEAQLLVNQRDQLYKSAKEIEIRLHQVVGAVDELNKLIQEGDKNEGNASGQSTVSPSVNEAE